MSPYFLSSFWRRSFGFTSRSKLPMYKVRVARSEYSSRSSSANIRLKIDELFDADADDDAVAVVVVVVAAAVDAVDALLVLTGAVEGVVAVAAVCCCWNGAISNFSTFKIVCCRKRRSFRLSMAACAWSLCLNAM